jgi:hypothetical protein
MDFVICPCDKMIETPILNYNNKSLQLQLFFIGRKYKETFMGRSKAVTAEERGEINAYRDQGKSIRFNAKKNQQFELDALKRVCQIFPCLSSGRRQLREIFIEMPATSLYQPRN